MIDPFSTFQHTAFRLEGLSRYDVDGDRERFAYFQETGEILPETDWAEFVASSANSGKRVQRLRLVSEPLSDYERYELSGAYSGVEAGGVRSNG